MRIMIAEERIPKLRRSLMDKLLEMFSADTEIAVIRRPVVNKKGETTSDERIVIVRSGNQDDEYTANNFLKDTEIARVFKIQSSIEQSTFLKRLEKRSPATLADIVEAIVITKTIRMKKKSN